jgi:hypothetical protein
LPADSGSETAHKFVREHRAVIASSLSPMLGSLMPAAHAFGAARLVWLIILVSVLIMAALIVPLQVKLYRQRRDHLDPEGRRSPPDGV